MNRELRLSSLADNGSFGLEYHLLGKKKTDLLMQGIEYCDIIINSAKEPIKKNKIIDEDKYEEIDTVQKYHKKDALIEYAETAGKIKKIIQDILDKEEKISISEMKIRSMQDFFNKTSLPILRGEMRKLRRKIK